MKQLVLEPTTQAQWRLLVHEAQSVCARRLDVVLESYLVFLLMRFTDKPEFTARIMAKEFLHSQNSSGRKQVDQLRDVGDQCLLFSGLFPQLAEKRLVRISYYVNLGKSSYHQLSGLLDRGSAMVYRHLSEAFVVLMDILQAMRELGGERVLTPLQAMELWEDTGSERAYHAVCTRTDSIPIPITGNTSRH